MIHRNKPPIDPEAPGPDEFERIHGYSIDDEPETDETLGIGSELEHAKPADRPKRGPKA